MAGGTACFRFHGEAVFQLLAKVEGGFHGSIVGVFHHVLIAVFEIEYFFEWAEVIFGGAMAIKAPSHRMRLGMINNLHLIHVAMAALTGNPAIDVGGVIEFHVIRCLVNTYPFDRFAIVTCELRVHRAMKRRQLWTIRLHVLVAVPTGIPGRNIRVPGHIHKRVTVTAIKPELIDVDFVGKRNGLLRLIAYNLSLRSRVIGKCQSHSGTDSSEAKCDFER